MAKFKTIVGKDNRITVAQEIAIKLKIKRGDAIEVDVKKL